MKFFSLGFFLFLSLFSTCLPMLQLEEKIPWSSGGLCDGFFFEKDGIKEEKEQEQEPLLKSYSPAAFPVVFETDDDIFANSCTPSYLTQRDKLLPWVNKLIDLYPKSFWAEMESKKNPTSCFLADLITIASEEDICALLEKLYLFGQTNKTAFYECIIGYSPFVNRLPLNELIKRISDVNSKIYQPFLNILDLIKSLPEDQRTSIFEKDDSDKLTPREIAMLEEKYYILDQLD